MVASTKLADASAMPVFLAEECPAANVRIPLRENLAGPCTFSAVFPEAITPVPLALNPLTPGPALRFSPDTALADEAEVSPITAVPELLNPATAAPLPLLPCTRCRYPNRRHARLQCPRHARRCRECCHQTRRCPWC